MEANPSIGSIGAPYYDRENDRVKFFSQQLYETHEKIDQQAQAAEQELLRQGASRFTGRFLASFPYHSSLTEARVPLNNGFSGLQLHYLALNSEERRSPDEILAEEDALLRDVYREGTIDALADEYSVERLRAPRWDDVQRLAQLYQTSFPTYLTTLDEDAVQGMIENNLVYVVRDESGLIVSSAVGEIGDVETARGNLRICEMSEMATDRVYRGGSLVSVAASRLVEEAQGMTDLIFTEARASHAAINRVFAKLGFSYAGRLHKHCVISGDREVEEQGPYENLNVWYMLPEGY